MPLAWAHAEFVKLVFSRKAGHPVDRPESVWQRYRGQPPKIQHAFWLQQAPIGQMHAGKKLYIGLHQASIIRWGSNNWQQIRNLPTWDSGIGIHVAEIDASKLKAGDCIDFTWYASANGEWIKQDYRVSIAGD